MGINKWMKAKLSLGLNCLYVPKTLNDSQPPVASLSPPTNHPDKRPTTTSSTSSFSSSSSSFKSGKNICAICLTTMRSGHGHAIFTAECSHAFHFHCIASNVKYGKQTCPICRAKWKEVPFQNTSTDKSHHKPRLSNAPRPQNRIEDIHDAIRRQIPPPRDTTPSPNYNFQYIVEPDDFDDDDEITSYQTSDTESSSSTSHHHGNASGTVEVKTFSEVSAVPKLKPHDNFCVLVHLKAPVTTKQQDSDGVQLNSQTSRAAIDLVTVLDVSGSMAGTKLALLKRAMGFVIQNLGPSDRLSVIAFSSTARRLFSLRKMTDTGKNEAVQAVNALCSNGGTNISEALRKAAKVISERRWKNPVSSIILLSDGQDTYTIDVSTGPRSSHNSLLPPSMRRDSASGFRTPVHAFGFGTDHDAMSMHSISEASGGTFSFIEAESMIQDAFAQCIGGLLSVVVQDVRVEIECIDPISQFVSIKSGSYKIVLASDRKRGSIEVGDLYAEEERDFLAMIDIPVHMSPSNEMSLLKVICIYTHPVTKNMSALDSVTVKLQRPMVTGHVVVSLEVDKQISRIRSAEAMVEARNAAERGDLAKAVEVLEKCRRKLSETMLATSGDRLYVSLNAELQEMQERMATRQVYETSGRAYILSGLSSHSWQRATARGDSTDSTSLIQAYQTQSMVDMVNLSQTMVFGGPSPRTIRPTLSLPTPLEPR